MVNRYMSTTHSVVARELANTFINVGRATFTMELSMVDMNTPVETSKRIR